MKGLVLSLFPGADLLGLAFEEAGWSVVHGPDAIFGRDVRGFHVPAGVFDGVIGGPPCQIFSTASRISGTDAIRSTNPGFCFLMAGWRRCGRTAGGLLVLEVLP